MNTDVKNTFGCFKVLLNLVNVKTFTAALKILQSFELRVGFGAKSIVFSFLLFGATLGFI